jgi:pimeloyl-ACP methyl ester carboxylesterase
MRLASVVVFIGLLALDVGSVNAQTALVKLNAYQGSFSVGGQYVMVPGVGTGGQSSEQIDGAMYVAYVIPYTVTHKYPIVLIHGGVGGGQAFTATPDGRTGWAQFLARQGFAVYVVDQPARGRSIYIPQLDGPIGNNTVLSMEQMYTATQLFNLWPQAHLHTQWPGPGVMGDPTFDAFMRGVLGALTTPGVQETLTRSAGSALLDRIGPAIVLGRSQSGAWPFLLADARPGMVKAILSVESAAPDLSTAQFPCFGCPQYNGNPSSLTPLWGITNTPITYAPAVTNPMTDLVRVPETSPSGKNLALCWKQGAPVHTLPTLKGIPTMVMVSQASAHAQYQHCMSEYLTQAGVKNDFYRLENVGILGNGHLMNIEKNSDQIAQFLINWLGTKGL